MSKIISKHCELVKLCHINRSGPFFRHSVCMYLVPFLRYSTLNNGVTLKSGLQVL